MKTKQLGNSDLFITPVRFGGSAWEQSLAAIQWRGAACRRRRGAFDFLLQPKIMIQGLLDGRGGSYALACRFMNLCHLISSVVTSLFEAALIESLFRRFHATSR